MIAVKLIDSLVQNLQKVFSDYALQSKGKSTDNYEDIVKNIKVYAQYIPLPSAVSIKPKEGRIIPQDFDKTDIECNFPCIIVKFNEMLIKEEGFTEQSRVKVKILVGVYDDEQAEQKEHREKSGDSDTRLKCQAWRDVVNIIEKIQTFLLTLENRILDDKYSLIANMKSYLFEDQPQPVYMGQIETEWDVARPLMPNFF
ncbi:MAG: hypothetical protein IJP96_05240 [Synergistaceae bacterium]|nr:hypothetical protein [Synergistaceae bacterium]MBR0075136.1 hypothetical protein [Synergistaceae bacterium]MBR0232580.1 hypothetical protein [Synergistaceae bacterium]